VAKFWLLFRNSSEAIDAYEKNLENTTFLLSLELSTFYFQSKDLEDISVA
jgi:hypothetical protein